MTTRALRVYWHQVPIPSNFTDRIRSAPYLRTHKVYKYIRKQYESDIIKCGSIRIGRITEFWTIENAALRDEREAIALAITPTGAPVSGLELPSGGLARDVVDTLFPNLNHERTTFEDVAFAHHFHEVYIYCFSYLCEASVMRSFMSEDPYDAVVEISDIFELAASIVRYHPSLRGWYWMCAPVAYVDKLQNALTAPVPTMETYFEKDAKFANNAEGRVIFLPPCGYLSPCVRPALELWQDKRIASLFRSVELPL